MLSCLLINVDSLLNENPRNPLIPISYADLSAEREGFEPPVPLGTVVTTLPSLQCSNVSKAGAKVRIILEMNKFFGNFLKNIWKIAHNNYL